MDWDAITVSLLLAAATAGLLIAPSLWLGRWLAYTTSPGKAVVEALVMLPLLLPPTVVGYYLLVTFSQMSPLGVWVRSFTGLQLVFTFEGLLLASTLVNIPFMVQPIHRSFAAIPNSLREAAWVSGLSVWRTLLRVELPLAWTGLLAGVALTFAHTLGEFGVVLMVGGNIPGETRTASIAIYDRLQAFDTSGAGAMALALVVCSLIALAVVFLAGARGRHVLHER
jgi:molybdate transport system permease protein